MGVFTDSYRDWMRRKRESEEQGWGFSDKEPARVVLPRDYTAEDLQRAYDRGRVVGRSERCADCRETND